MSRDNDPTGPLAGLSPSELRRWEQRAQTLARKSAEFFSIVEARLGADDHQFTPYVGDTMCSADELRNILESAIESRSAGQ